MAYERIVAPSFKGTVASLPFATVTDAPGEVPEQPPASTTAWLRILVAASVGAALTSASLVCFSGGQLPRPAHVSKGSVFDDLLIAADADMLRFSGMLKFANAHPNEFVPIEVSAPFRDESVLTAEGEADSPVISTLRAGSYGIVGLQYFNASKNGKLRAKLVNLGWVTVFEMDSLISHLDLPQRPELCTLKSTTFPTGSYFVRYDETPVTAAISPYDDVVQLLGWGGIVDVVEVHADVDREMKVRGKLSDGNWMTLANLNSCQLRVVPNLKGTPSPQRKGTFLILGDWGWDKDLHFSIKSRECQEIVSLKMRQAFDALSDVKFVINVGDSFYPTGVRGKNDTRWQTQWRDVYDEKLRSVPWYSVYGNHDLHNDPCACGDDNDCAQVNSDPDNREWFYMPSPSYFVEHPEMDLELIALDFNFIGDSGVCQYTACPHACNITLLRRAREAVALLGSRLRESSARNLVIFSHYPTDYLLGTPQILNALANSRQNILYVGGHRHSVDNTSTVPIGRHASWVVGGGGGWSCDGEQGFLIGYVDISGAVRTHLVDIAREACCR